MPKCKYCRYDYPAAQTQCPHCARPASHYPNVTQAGSHEERQALDARYSVAVREASANGCESVVQELEAAVTRSKAVIARSYGDILRLASSADQILSTYHQLIAAGNRLFRDHDSYNRLRIVADPALFPGYHEDIRFAALSDVFHGRTRVTGGYRGTWGERGKIAVAKLASRLTSHVQASDFAALLMAEAKNGEDEFIEVHIWGPITVKAIETVAISSTKRPARQLMRDGDIELLTKAGISVKVT
jgi:hypothetical protein